jgi:predicted dinucleotide-utilizing enzyme
VIVGMGNLGAALANYGGFASRGFRIAALIDADASLAGKLIAGLPVRHAEELEEIVDDNQVSIGVITTPAGAAQEVCDRLVGAGVTSILNFAPTVLTESTSERSTSPSNSRSSPSTSSARPARSSTTPSPRPPNDSRPAPDLTGTSPP